MPIYLRYANVWRKLVIRYKWTVCKYAAAGDNAIHLFAADEPYFFALWRKGESSSGAGYMIEPAFNTEGRPRFHIGDEITSVSQSKS